MSRPPPALRWNLTRFRRGAPAFLRIDCADGVVADDLGLYRRVCDVYSSPAYQQAAHPHTQLYWDERLYSWSLSPGLFQCTIAVMPGGRTRTPWQGRLPGDGGPDWIVRDGGVLPLTFSSFGYTSSWERAVTRGKTRFGELQRLMSEGATELYFGRPRRRARGEHRVHRARRQLRSEAGRSRSRGSSTDSAGAEAGEEPRAWTQPGLSISPSPHFGRCAEIAARRRAAQQAISLIERAYRGSSQAAASAAELAGPHAAHPASPSSVGTVTGSDGSWGCDARSVDAAAGSAEEASVRTPTATASDCDSIPDSTASE